MSPLLIGCWGIVGCAALMLLAYSMLIAPRHSDRRLLDSISAFGKAIELRFPPQEGMMARLSSLTTDLSRSLHLENRTDERLRRLVRLRSIGLCAVPYKLGNGESPKDWDQAEAQTYARHFEVSGAMLELSPVFRDLARLIRFQGARFDGLSGSAYPAGEDIPIESRIIRLVGDYVWLERWQGNLLARESIRDGAHHEYDPALVAKFLEVLTSSGVRKPDSVFNS